MTSIKVMTIGTLVLKCSFLKMMIMWMMMLYLIQCIHDQHCNYAHKKAGLEVPCLYEYDDDVDNDALLETEYA